MGILPTDIIYNFFGLGQGWQNFFVGIPKM
jgi:hypothetical protein